MQAHAAYEYSPRADLFQELMEMVDNPISESLSALAARAIEWSANNATSAVRKRFARYLNKDVGAFKTYLERKVEAIHKIKNILYSNPVSIESLYVPVTLSAMLKHETITKKDEEFLAYLDLTKTVVVEAIAGAGKSIFIRKVFLDALKRHSSPPRIPILFELRSVNEVGKQSLEIELFKDVQSFEPALMLEQWSIGLQSGLFYLLLDGFDEINPELKAHYRSEIRTLVRKYPLCRLAITTRPDEMTAHADGFQVMRVEPLTKEDVFKLIGRVEFDETVKCEFLERVDSDLYNSHRSFLERPLLAIMMLITYNEKRDIEFKLTRFYQDAYAALYYLHDVRKGGFRRKFHSGLDRDQFFNLLKGLSVLSYLENRYRLSDVELQKFLAKAMVMNGIQADPADVIYDLVSSLCLFQRDGVQYSFVHRSFQEYFAAEFVSMCAEEQAMRLISVLARRIGTDSTILMLRDINETLLDVRWLLPKLEHLQQIAETTSDAFSLQFLDAILTFEITRTKNQAASTYEISIDRKDPLGVALQVGCAVFSQTYFPALEERLRHGLGDFGCLANLARQTGAIDASTLFDAIGPATKDLSPVSEKIIEIRSFLNFAATTIKKRYSASAGEIDVILGKKLN